MERFWSKVDSTAGPDGCWPWTRSVNKDGYGWFKLAGKMRKAHQVSYLLTKGEIPTGLCVLHTCDNPPCVNPNHLWVGTAGDNSRDCEAKGRRPHNMPRGEANHRSRLTDEDVIEIRRAYPSTTQSRLAAQYGITQTAVSKIVRRMRWTHV